MVIGAGFGGLRALLELRGLGLETKVLEAGGGVGGTWYWNRYPGARSDSEAWSYCYSFSRELWNEWDWPDRLPGQSDVLAYLDHVADRMDLRKDIVLETRVTRAEYRERQADWQVETDLGDRYRCRYLVSAGGILSVPIQPAFDGLDTFEGDWYMTSRWPAGGVDVAGRRVAIVGSGATAVQVLPIVAKTAGHVTLLQRTPNYVIPARNRPLEDGEREALKAGFEEVWREVRNQVFALPIPPANRVADGLPPGEIERILERGWERGGFQFIFETFDDLLVNERSNALAAEFIRKKIRTIVVDPAVAEALCPRYPLMAKRPPLGTEYYESFNRDNVSLVDVSGSPIGGITPTGIRVADRTVDCDVIVFALGFDAGTGALSALEVTGPGGVTIRDKWREGPRTHLGIMVDGFPNLFMISGPQSPFANIPPVVENSVDWIGKAILAIREKRAVSMEPKEESVAGWAALLKQYVDATVIRHGSDVRSWFVGANVEGKPTSAQFHFGGAATYFAQLEQSMESGFDEFRFRYR
ncbi:MAG: NAD(P)/FAD-dependent oxidoreductase [Gammaproteobacteria bacterium]|nr:NAD(P)/FAD-dependent oxidoreductase [Gammaproteobacteria bacterium]